MNTMEQTITNRQQEIILGSLLGDGSLTKRYGTGNSTFREGHSQKQYEYLLWKQQELKPICPALRLEIRGANNLTGKQENSCWVLETRRLPALSEMESRWYLRNEEGNYVLDKKGWRIKVVPPDLHLSALSFAVWFLDDGSVQYRNRQATLHTLSFKEEECAFLSDQIRSRFGFRSCHSRAGKRGPEVVIGAGSFADFIDMMSEMVPHESMRYKANPKAVIPAVGYRLYGDDLIDQVVAMRRNGIKQRVIAQETGMSEATVSSIIQGKRWTSRTGIGPDEAFPCRAESGVPGVYRHSKGKGWVAYINKGSGMKYLGYFNSIKDAVAAIQREGLNGTENL